MVSDSFTAATDITLTTVETDQGPQHKVCWNEGDFPMEETFARLETAKLLIAHLEDPDNVEPPSVDEDCSPLERDPELRRQFDVIHDLLGRIDASPAMLRDFLRALFDSRCTFASWVVLARESIVHRRRMEDIAAQQKTPLKELLFQLEELEQPLEDVLQHYREHLSKTSDQARQSRQRQTREALQLYVEMLKKDEPDPDERRFTVHKIERFLAAFDLDLERPRDEMLNWIAQQPGSARAQRHYREIVEEFLEFRSNVTIGEARVAA